MENLLRLKITSAHFIWLINVDEEDTMHSIFIISVVGSWLFPRIGSKTTNDNLSSSNHQQITVLFGTSIFPIYHVTQCSRSALNFAVSLWFQPYAHSWNKTLDGNNYDRRKLIIYVASDIYINTSGESTDKRFLLNWTTLW